MRAALHLSMLVAVAAAAGPLTSCVDPVHDDAVAALPPEAQGVPRGEFHRAGQPCTTCHGPEGPAKQFSIAGTIFWQPYSSSKVGANQAIVSIVDSLNNQIQLTTNCVGNFWVTPEAYNPAFPILVSVFKDGQTYTQAMVSEIGRASSCADCHREPGASSNSVGQVFLTTGAIPTNEVPTSSCPVDPNVANVQYGGQY
jgi:hypothetical protein